MTATVPDIHEAAERIAGGETDGWATLALEPVQLTLEPLDERA
jgi:hypothetical protein